MVGVLVNVNIGYNETTARQYPVQ